MVIDLIPCFQLLLLPFLDAEECLKILSFHFQNIDKYREEDRTSGEV